MSDHLWSNSSFFVDGEALSLRQYAFLQRKSNTLVTPVRVYLNIIYENAISVRMKPEKGKMVKIGITGRKTG